jgi:hypothetical protein
MQPVSALKPFNGRDGAILILHGKREARIDALAICEHCAGAAGALIAASLCTGKMKVVSKKVEERGANVECQLVRLAVDTKKHGGCSWQRAPQSTGKRQRRLFAIRALQ